MQTLNGLHQGIYIQGLEVNYKLVMGPNGPGSGGPNGDQRRATANLALAECIWGVSASLWMASTNSQGGVHIQLDFEQDTKE